ncbi:MAG: hypothetical protein WD271_04370 [Acidimicrobiia bacterium]
MGFWERRRQRAATRAAQQTAAARRATDANWQSERAQLVDMIRDADQFNGFTRAEAPDLTVQLTKDERVLGVLQGCALLEPRRAPGHYSGGYQGFSFKIAKGVRYHVGGSRGTFVPGDEQPTVIDQGVITITTRRVIFQGAKQAREWSFAKLLGVQHDPVRPWTAISVSNRQKVSGFLYDRDHTEDIRFRLTLALAIFNDGRGALAADLKRQLAEHDAERSSGPAALPGAADRGLSAG